MAVFTDINHLRQFRNAVLTIGTFDGVHTGHRAILNEVVQHAGRVGGESVLLTFEPHPRKVLFPEQPLGILTPLNKKLSLVTDTGIDHVVVVPFTPVFANLSATEYVRNFLVDTFHPHSIVIGYDHHFGHDRTGNIDLLRRLAPEYGYEVLEIPAQLIADAAVSSTRIRNAISAGNVTEAMAMLGRIYTVSGKVVHGNRLGRTIGYPTANMAIDETDQIMPGVGIYAVQVLHNGALYGGMMSIGYNPTVTDSRDIKAEVHIFDFDAEIYGHELEIGFMARLRDEQKFFSLEQLTEQLHADKVAALQVLQY